MFEGEHFGHNIFDLWNNPEEKHRWKRTKLVIDVPDDYDLNRQTRTRNITTKRAALSYTHSLNSSKPKRPKVTAVKCANDCHRTIQYDDPFQKDAMQYCDQSEFYTWISDNEGCFRWLCNYCRIKSIIPIDSLTWFCDDHVDMHKEDDTFDKESHSN